MTLGTLLPINHVVVRMRAPDKARLLADLANRLAPETGHTAAEIVAQLTAREELGSTGIGSGIAVPHARLDRLKSLIGFFARLDRPIDFGSIDGKPVDLVFLLLSSTQGNTEHLAALAAVSRRLRDRSVADAIRAAKDAKQVRVLLVGRE